MNFRTAAFALTVALPGFAQEPAQLEKLVGEATLSLAEAVDKGLAEAKDGVPFHAELEKGDKGAEYSIDVAQGTKTCNVVVGAKDGKILERETEDEDHSKAVETCKIPLKDAIAAALKGARGKAVEAQLSAKTGRPIITVKVLADGKLDIVRIDGANGQVLAAEAPRPPDPPYTDTFRVDAKDWSSTGSNPYFVLEPGYVLVLEGKDGRGSRSPFSTRRRRSRASRHGWSRSARRRTGSSSRCRATTSPSRSGRTTSTTSARTWTSTRTAR